MPLPLAALNAYKLNSCRDVRLSVFRIRFATGKSIFALYYIEFSVSSRQREDMNTLRSEMGPMDVVVGPYPGHHQLSLFRFRCEQRF